MSDLPDKLREHAKHVMGVLIEQDLRRAANEIEWLQKRIKELEKKLQDQAAGFCVMGYHITSAQIDAAWAKVDEGDEFGAGAGEALEELGIVRCRGCGGDGWVDYDSPPAMRRMCLDCNGRGWVMGADDD